ncbi:MAG TPA: hypothetical protein VJK52_05445 [Candidatus Nanoarchaeia archaeon]|nr:hypothetical protein [Candidatus Nanoarchaeia archaeon]
MSLVELAEETVQQCVRAGHLQYIPPQSLAACVNTKLLTATEKPDVAALLLTRENGNLHEYFLRRQWEQGRRLFVSDLRPWNDAYEHHLFPELDPLDPTAYDRLCQYQWHCVESNDRFADYAAERNALEFLKFDILGQDGLAEIFDALCQQTLHARLAITSRSILARFAQD